VVSVTKRFLGTVALRDVSLAIPRNTVFGLVGPNGSGKSTLLNLVAGVYRVDSGRIMLGGAEITNWPPHRIASRGIGRTFQVPQLINECSVLQNIELGLIYRYSHPIAIELLGTPACRTTEKVRLNRAREILSALGIDHGLGNRKVSELPLGLKRIVEIGRALALNPRLLLLDEPTAGLNPEERREVGNLVVRQKSRDVTVLIVEHNVPFVLAFCDRVALLEQGSVVSVGSTRERLAPPLAAYLSHGAVS
jgi:ABC-type branched-subunit amino acid transport system ATPase component